jgi:uncharacterized protein (TIGR00297 family)
MDFQASLGFFDAPMVSNQLTLALIWSSPLPPATHWLPLPWLVGLGLNTGLAAIARIAPKQLLTPSGLLHAWILGIILWGTLGWRGYLVMMVYFLVGSGVTRIGQARKEAAGIAEKRSGARGPENVWGSAFVGTVCAVGVLLAGLLGQAEGTVVPLLLLGYVASIATKLSDTTASEVGKAYGRRTFLITTLQPVRGLWRGPWRRW